MSKRTGLLVVGVGSIGERHVRCFQSTGRVDISVCEINARLREEVGERYGLQRTYETLQAALAHRHDAAVICTPAHLHIDMALQLCQSGAHLLIEKPLSTSLANVDDLRRALERQRRVASVAYVYRAHPALEAMKHALDSGRFGRPVQLVANCGQHFPTYRPAYRDIYYADRASGGGAIQDALTHVINAGEWLVGPVQSVAADADHLVLEGVQVEDTVHVLARHGKVLGCYSLNQHQAPNETTITVNCIQGTARFEAHRNRWQWMAGPEEGWHDENFPALERDELFKIQANRFLDTLAGQRPPACSLDEGMQTLRVNLAVLAAAESKSWQDVV